MHYGRIELHIASIPWKENMEQEDLLALRIWQLERRQEDIGIATEKLKKERLKNKEFFDKKHRLRPREIKEGDWVHYKGNVATGGYTGAN